MDNILTDEHASRGPSGASGWGKCPAKPRLELGVPERHSIFAELGTAAHELLETCFLTKTTPESHRGETVNLNNPVQSDGFIVDQNMIDAVTVAYNIVNDILKENENTTDLLFYPERKVDPGIWVNGRTDMWGTSDITIITHDTIYSLDYKHGQGIMVEVSDNWQLILYLIGVLADIPRDRLLQMRKLVIGIIQPRAFHKDGAYRTQEIALADIPAWVDFFTLLTVRTDDPAALPIPGEKQCRFCNANPCSGMVTKISTDLGLCANPIMGYVTLEQVNQLSFEMEQAVSVSPEQLTPLQRRAWLDNANLIRASLDAIESLTLAELKDGTAAPEITEAYKLVNKASRRKFAETDVTLLIKKLSSMKFHKEEITKTTVLTPNQVLSAAKAKGFTDRKMRNLENLVIKPEGALTIAPISDPRQPARETTAEEMFGEAK